MSKFNFSTEQEQHAGELIFYFAQQAQHKYKLGAIEHDSNLWEFTDDQLIEMALEEVIDLMHYLTTLLTNRRKRAQKADK